MELGGKSPVIVAQDADLKESARPSSLRQKPSVTGQTCVAPDYALVHRGQQDAFIQAYFEVIQQFYPDSIRDNPDYTAIVSEHQFERLRHYLIDARQKGARLIQIEAAPDGRRMPVAPLPMSAMIWR